MREFNYKKYKEYRWDNEILNYLSQIHEHKGKQELFLRQKPVEMERKSGQRGSWVEASKILTFR